MNSHTVNSATCFFVVVVGGATAAGFFFCFAFIFIIVSRAIIQILRQFEWVHRSLFNTEHISICLLHYITLNVVYEGG